MLICILNFIRLHWRGVVESLLLAAMFLQHVEVSHLASNLARSKAQNAALFNANQQLFASVQSQNAAVASLQAEAKKRNAAAAKAFLLAQGDARKYTATAARIKSWKPTGNTCTDMKKLLNEYVRHGE